MKIVLPIFLLCVLLASLKAADERVWIDAKINEKPVRFVLDTACNSSLILYSSAAQKLGLKLITSNSQSPKLCGIVFKTTEPVDFQCEWAKTTKTSICVWPTPDLNYPEDGVLGWPFIRQYLNKCPLSLDLATNKLALLNNLPSGTETWSKFQLETNLEVLALQIPKHTNKVSVLVFDTGTPYGTKLSPEKIQTWAMTNTKPTTTLEAYKTMDNHLVVAEQSWAKSVFFGPFEITEVPIQGADPNDIATALSPSTQLEAVLGLAALKRLDVIIDNPNNVAYLRLKKTPPPPYQHNRLGAIFIPGNSGDTNFTARVTAGSPAYKAGIRDGDILLNQEINGTFEQPAGTKISFKLRRGNKLFKTTAILENILVPDSLTISN